MAADLIIAGAIVVFLGTAGLAAWRLIESAGIAVAERDMRRSFGQAVLDVELPAWDWNGATYEWTPESQAELEELPDPPDEFNSDIFIAMMRERTDAYIAQLAET